MKNKDSKEKLFDALSPDQQMKLEIAEELGLPKEFAWRKKQGAQYGSRFDKAIEKLSKINGMKSKQEYIESLF